MRLVLSLRRRRRLVRLHLDGDKPSVEGVLVGVVDGHYELAAAKLLERADRTLELRGTTLVPRERVLYVQVLG